MIKKKLLVLGLAFMLSLGSTACGKKDEAGEDTKNATEASYTINPENTPKLEGDLADVEVSKDGKVRSDLTGEWIDKDLARRKPIACTINNIIDAMPQSSVEKADVIYEMLEEGGITRLLCIFTDYDDLEKIGPMRSARYYFLRKAVEHQAVLVHWGRADNILPDFDNYPGVEHVDFNFEAGGFRSDDRPAPHNAYVSGATINNWRKNQVFQIDKNENYKKMFHFNNEDTVPDGEDANKITTAFNEGRKPWFEYDPELKLYKRFQYGEPQIDKESGNQLMFKNVIIIFTYHGLCAGDNPSGWIDIELVGGGDGYYASDGKIIPIKWKKDGYTDVTQYYTTDGEKLTINPGKTWITYLQDDNKEGCIVE